MGTKSRADNLTEMIPREILGKIFRSNNRNAILAYKKKKYHIKIITVSNMMKIKLRYFNCTFQILIIVLKIK